LHLEVEAGLASTTWRLFTRRQQLQQENVAFVEATVARIRPDAAMIWGMWNVPRVVPATVERLLGPRVAYYLCDYWPALPSAYYQKFASPARLRLAKLPKRLLAWPFRAYLAREPEAPLRLERVFCVSGFVRDTLQPHGFSGRQWRVINNGIHLDNFPAIPSYAKGCARRALKLVYVGRLAADKGVHTAVRALTLVSDPGRVTLDLIGTGDPSYERELRDLVQHLHLEGRVAFRGRLPRAQIPGALTEYDALLFPSEWAEPLARTPMEALAVGLPVIGTTTGGTGEILVEDVTALTFPPGDAQMLAACIDRLHHDPDLRRRLAHEGRRWVEEKFSFSRMVDEIETVLREMATNANV
jgi:glycosyltransferase involved in cell wall biosynthesis